MSIWDINRTQNRQEERKPEKTVMPHLMQSDSTDQAIANINNAQVITFDTDVHLHKIVNRDDDVRVIL